MDMTNEELQALFELRASKVKMDPRGFWDCNKIVYWNDMIPRLLALYEIMLEIQARYPKDDICKYPGSYEPKLLPVLKALAGKQEDADAASGTDAATQVAGTPGLARAVRRGSRRD